MCALYLLSYLPGLHFHHYFSNDPNNASLYNEAQTGVYRGTDDIVLHTRVELPPTQPWEGASVRLSISEEPYTNKTTRMTMMISSANPVPSKSDMISTSFLVLRIDSLLKCPNNIV